MSSDVDISLVTKNKDLQSQVDSLQSHVTKLQEQLRQAATRQTQSDERESQLLKEKATLEQDLQRSAQSNHTEELSKELAALRIKMTEMEKTHADVLADTQGKLDAARAELTGKIQATAQYRQLQKMVQDKNNLLKELRANLRVYEEKSAE
jgi:chromosome segregation ATPase